MLKVAFPALIVPVPSVVLPSVNVTVPVAVVGATVAVNVTEAPYADGFAEEASVTGVFVLFTICVRLVEVLYVALPLLIVAVPSVLLPSVNVTVPVAVVGVTVAVNVTDEPYADGF